METILITGVTRGLGRALAEALHEKGYRINGCGRDREALAELSANLGAEHSFAEVDVGDGRAVQRWVDDEVLQHGCPTRVINNAAVINQPAPLWEVSEEEMARLLRINVAGTVNVIRAVMPHLMQRGRGMIINMSSGAGRMGLPRIAAYCATKWAIEGLTQSLASELPTGVGAVALSPGMVNTDMLQICYPEEASAHDSPEHWARLAADYILQLTPADSGKSLRTPGGDGD
jgi:NAD(P)-dependent dehydrogenase (short-subunit alcohol dehydrogenase family)